MNIIKTLSVVALFCTAFSFYAFMPAGANVAGDKINWMSWEEAIAATEKEPRKIVIDVYTGWCHWCKVMDNKTFNQKEVIDYVNENYYAVKLNAEQKEDINFSGNTFKFIASGRRGYHELASALLDKRMSYPSIVYMDEKVQRIMISPGFKDKDAFMTELKYAKEEAYKTTTFDKYKAGK